MNAALPHDLVNFSSIDTNISTCTDKADIQHERQQILHTFWNVHAVRHKVSKHSSDARSCNLFWRVWGSSTLSRSIGTDTLTALWDRCRNEQDLRSPHDSVRTSSNLANQPDTPNHNVTRMIPNPPEQSPDGRGHSSESPNSLQRQTQPEVKQSNVADSPSETSGTSSNEVDASSSSRSKHPRGHSSRNSTARTSMTGRDKPAIRPRLRPWIGRRKSSQAGKTPKSPTHGLDLDAGLEPEASKSPREAAAAFDLASPSSWEDEPSMTSSQLSPKQPSPDIQLVIDKDFRGKFVEKIASSTNIAGMSRMKKTGSVVRFADEPRPSMSRPKESLSTTFEYSSRPSLPHRPSASSVVISDDDFDAETVPKTGLQRTTSSLSILLQQTQLGKSPLIANQALNEDSQQKGKGKGKGREERITEEEELLAMGRRGGVTKEGGIQLPPQQRLKGHIESGYSSPEPEPLF